MLNYIRKGCPALVPTGPCSCRVMGHVSWYFSWWWSSAVSLPLVATGVWVRGSFPNTSPTKICSSSALLQSLLHPLSAVGLTASRIHDTQPLPLLHPPSLPVVSKQHFSTSSFVQRRPQSLPSMVRWTQWGVCRLASWTTLLHQHREI